MQATRRAGRIPDSARAVFVPLLAMLAFLSVTPAAGAGQDSIPPVDSVAVAPAPAALPVFLTLGLGYGQRSDPCAHCTSPDNTDSFTGHLSVGRYLVGGLGVGIDASVWRRGHPGPLADADTAGVRAPTTLSNTLGNASLTFSYQLWHLFVRAGGGLSWGGQDLVETDADGAPTVVRASGMGIGYSVGGGVTLPLASMASIAFFGNWNVGRYDLVSPTAVLQRNAEHEYVELGMGITLR